MDGILSTLSATIAFGITALLGLVIIPFLTKLKYGQTILDIGPNWHKSKQGTPTMGGIMFIIGIVVSVIITYVIAYIHKDNRLAMEFLSGFDQQKKHTIRIIAGILMALGFGAVGFIDDYIKVVKKRNLGLTARQKTLFQLLIASAFLAVLALTGDTTTHIPFVNVSIDVSKGWGLIFWPIALMFIYGFVNSVNLTDGIDGLCGSVTMIVSIFFMMLSGALAMSGMNVLCSAVAGGCGGFLVWNLKPARVFMGDTGSLFLGGIAVAMAFASGYPIMLMLAGLVYFIEALSVMFQVAYYKKTKKRLFKMAPIHHHFEMSGWSENKIVLVFSLATVLFCAIGVLPFVFGV